MNKTHELKTWPVFFQAILDRTKLFEVRFDDRNFSIGDHLLLKEWKPDRLMPQYTGREIEVEITFVYREHMEDGYCVLGIRPPFVV